MANAFRPWAGVVAIVVLGGFSGVSHAQLVPAAAEFRVNEETSGLQSLAQVSADAAGNFVVTWSSFGQDGDRWGVFARRYGSSGNVLAGEFQVNTVTTFYQYKPAVAHQPGGGFIVTWEEVSIGNISAQRFSTTGGPLGSEFQVNTSTGYHAVPGIAVDGSGAFVIAWNGFDGSAAGIFAQRYDSAGAAQGTEFQVNDYTYETQDLGGIAAAAGGFVVVWTSFLQDGDLGGVFARRYDSGGNRLGDEFQVNTYTTSTQIAHDIAAGPTGDFTVVWSSYGSHDGSGFGVFGQRFDSVGARVGSEFQVNTYTSGQQVGGAIAIGASGDFVVVWKSLAQDGDDEGIFARAFHEDGSPDGDAVQVNEFTHGFQVFPSVTATTGEDFVVVWESEYQDGSYNGVYARRFTRAGVPVRGKKLLLRTPASGPSQNKLVYIATGTELEAPESAAQDPRCPPVGSGSLSSGARLRVTGSGGDFTIDLPCVNWSVDSTGTRYRYRDGSGTTCKAVLFQAGRMLKASCKGPQVAYALGLPQANLHVVLATGDPASNRKYCSSFGQQASAHVLHDGSDGKRFMAINPDLGVCP